MRIAFQVKYGIAFELKYGIAFELKYGIAFKPKYGKLQAHIKCPIRVFVNSE